MSSTSPLRALAGALLLLAPAGCSLLRTAAEAPGHVAGAILPEDKSKKKKLPSHDAVLADLMRYTDLVVLRVDNASRLFESATPPGDAQLRAASWRLETLRATTQYATSPKPGSSTLDVVVLTTAFRWQLEDHWKGIYGDAAVQPMIEALDHCEQDGWTLLQRYLSAEEVAQARSVLVDWRKAHPKLDADTLAQYPSFSMLVEERPDSADTRKSLLGAIGLDPLEGLEPAARQIEEARQLGQRALFFAQRATRLVAAEAELRTLQLRGSKEVVQVLDNTERITRSVETFTATAADLPAALGRELEAQRTGLLADLERTNAPLESLLRETQNTLAAGERMSVELTHALNALDAFVGRFDQPEAAAAPLAGAPATEPAAEPPAKPFDVTEYGDAAEQLGRAASELRGLLTEVDRVLPEAQRVLDEAATRSERTIDHALLRAVAAGLALIVAAALAAVLVRRARPTPRAPA